jgi:hypothetical protein
MQVLETESPGGASVIKAQNCENLTIFSNLTRGACNSKTFAADQE